MRIVAGRFRGRRLEAPAGAATRPTADRVRVTLFSMLVSRIGSFDDLSVADLFAGSGALGFEALSRGAATACFVERDRAAVAAIRANAEKLGVADAIRLVTGSALALPPSPPFDLIFADPPYAPGAGSALIDAVERAGWLAPAGWLALEVERGATVAPGSLAVEVERDVGRARIILLRKA